MNAADVGRHTPDPPANVLYSGKIERDPSGDPSGVFRDRAKRLIQDAIPAITIAEREHQIRTACAEYNRLGITSAADPGLFPDQLHAYQNVFGGGHLTVRVSLCVGGWGFGTPADDATVERRIEDMAVYTGYGNPWLRMDAVKFMPDGGVGDRTALMFDPYEGEPDNRGQFIIAERDLFAYIAWCHERGWSVDCHACGDRMIELCVRAYAQAQERNPNRAIRHRIHHAYLPTSATLEIMREHRIPALATIPFLTNLGESFVTSLGEERASGIMPLRTYLDAGIPLALGSDAPVTTHNPFVGIYAASTRELGPDERISRLEAIRAYTRDAAWVTFEDDIKGTLSPGKLADLAVLDRDVMEVPDEELKETTSALTIVGGRVVHDALVAMM
jgi:predicted amidohydrolase YtcJ